MDRTTLCLPLPTPFSPDLTLQHLRTSSFGAPYQFFDDSSCVRRLISHDNGTTVVEFDFDAGDSLVRITARGHGPLEELKTLARRTWGLDDDLEMCYGTLNRDPHLAPLVGRYSGLRLVRAPTVYEALVTAIVGQQVSVAAAQAVRRRLMEALGPRLVSDGRALYAYPRPEILCGVNDQALRELGISRQKARYLREIARRAVVGELDNAVFTSLSDDQAVKRLLELPGVGPWTAEIVLMRGLGRLDVFPAGDLGLVKAMQAAWELEQRPSEAELREHARPWRNWRTYAALYLWETLHETPKA